MKVRVKGSPKKVFDVSDLTDLHEQVTRDVGAAETVILSLNGTDPLPSDGQFSDYGIVNGDLLRIMSSPSDESNIPSTSREDSTSNTSRKPSTVEEIFKKFDLKVHSSQDQQHNLTYHIIPGATIIYMNQQVGPMSLVNIIITYAGETFVDSVAASPNETDFLKQISAAFEKQLEKLRKAANLRPLSGILSLPDELLITILSKLNAKSLAKAGMTCKKIKQIADSDQFWKTLYLKVRVVPIELFN